MPWRWRAAGCCKGTCSPGQPWASPRHSGDRHAWDRRGRAKELHTRGQSGPVTVEIKYRERPGQPTITYHLAIDEGPKGPRVASEWLQWKRGTYGRPFRFLDHKHGEGGAFSGETPDDRETRAPKALRSPDILAVSTLGQLAEHPRVAAPREFITDWYVSDLSIVMGLAYKADFRACRPWGRQGDRKNDGYLKSDRRMFQVYAPNEMDASTVKAKITADFEGAKEHWKEHFDSWSFVHNATDGLPPHVLALLLNLEATNPGIKLDSLRRNGVGAGPPKDKSA